MIQRPSALTTLVVLAQVIIGLFVMRWLAATFPDSKMADAIGAIIG
jgi:hypothetical protein